ncbi:nuclear transport factor 2 family protein [Vulcanococcus limneticus Candia 3F8]|uniref:nuclear transport factor 2 family protein n=1 Tax=Vulcanococcus limneticus TaxID=2170428 RepID=UPI000B9890D6|nr:nuclear transport factor 2 family protein [Vulcanococcus limneticus]MCP9792119.1 nuclear transport factor 2 family protein [Vulcanococcus limneticus MW73D5]MCP9893926.1 nuclear transport factor 2 family protein [Vulcanococcus limneticus Candia 3F8]MCP9897467.1 nuclear transport factor 2 family protein [Vulcanococcus limneticus Candia 3B3]
MSSPTEFDAIHSVLQLYFDGLYHSDTTLLAQVFHQDALYATAVADKPIVLRMDEYFPVVDARPAPAASSQPRTDRVLSIELIGPVTAHARLQCSIPPRDFIDLLTLIHVDGRWQVISKVFHSDVRD